ncbi:MAG TPA: phage tail protein [Erwinia sp.]|nr:phage tail protein [Erwinia sp.]
MNKPQSLRSALNKSVPYVADNPDRLHLFVDSGQLVATSATSAASLSWEYRYTLNVVITDFTGDQNLLMAPVLLWLRENQSDALQNSEAREKLFSFEVDILANDRCDISMDLKLTERVVATTVDGKISIEAVPEPDVPEEVWTVKRG